jgi:hypothetical protein
MVNYHTRALEKEYHPRRSRGWYSFSRVWLSAITPSTKGSMFFIILNASSKEDIEFLLESVNQWDTLCTYHYLNKATTTNISTSNIFINNNRGCYYRKWLIDKTRTERVLFSGSAKFGSGGWYCRGCYYGRGCYYDLIPTPRKSIKECQMPIIQWN